jgi:CheY-like chemotaxis protein
MVPELKSNPEPARILVIEDEILIRCLIADELREAGFTVIETQNADEASSYLKCGASVDLIFSDVHMPGSMNGLDLARRIRNERPLLPIILTSGRMGPEDVGGAILLLPKPYELRHAVALVRSALRAASDWQ